MDKIRIIQEPTESKPYIVIYKPKGLPTAPLTSEDKENALAQAIELYPAIKTVKGRKEIEYGLLHRLDTPTDGLVVISVTQEAYDFLMEEQKAGRFIKTYSADCNILPDSINNYLEGFPPAVQYIGQNQLTAESFFRPFGTGSKEVRPVTEASGKAALKKVGNQKKYTTEITITNHKENSCIVECTIKEGFRHQVRCHLAWMGLPIIGDQLYNPDKKNAENQLRFSATKLKFEYPKGDLNSYEITFTWT